MFNSKFFQSQNFKQVVILFVGICIGIMFFSYSNAEKNNNSNDQASIEDVIPDYKGLFDQGSTPRNYLDNGNFYSQDKPRRLGIDTSFIDPVDASIWWYDKVISEFPRTNEANIAFREKIKTLIGWSDGYGDDKEYFGLYDRRKDKIYFPMVEETFTLMENIYPDDDYLEALAFQIAQRYLWHVLAYGRQNYKVDCKKWLNKTIELSKGKDTFYSHIAKLRLPLVQD